MIIAKLACQTRQEFCIAENVSLRGAAKLAGADCQIIFHPGGPFTLMQDGYRSLISFTLPFFLF